MSYINSENVFVFPCVSRLQPYDSNAKLMSEENITSILRSATNIHKYIIDFVPGDLVHNLGTLRLVVDGYYFELSNFELTGDRFARVEYKSRREGETGFTLLNGDEDTQFKGLVIYDEAPEGEPDYLTICLDGEIPESSYERFSLNRIDCGDLK